MKTYTPAKGISIYGACEEAVQLARALGQSVHFTFNEIELCASPFSHADDIAEIYSLRCELRRLNAGVCR